MSLLTNEAVLAIKQDAADNRARRVAAAGSTEVWARDLSGGRKVPLAKQVSGGSLSA